MTDLYITFALYNGDYHITGGACHSLEEAHLEANEQGGRYYSTHHFDGNDYIEQFDIYERLAETKPSFEQIELTKADNGYKDMQEQRSGETI